MKIAIHNRPGSFSDRWIPYCTEKEVPFKTVNCYDSDIVSQLNDCDGLMWHWDQNDYRAQNFARQLIISLEKAGKIVFPDVNTCWHFDDKVGQKYLLESIDAPMVPSYTFHSKIDALKWVNKTTFPKVFKLRGGAGALNVKLISDIKMAKKLTRKAFRNGFPLVNQYDGLKQRFWVLNRDKNLKSIVHVAKGFIRLVWPATDKHLLPQQKGYVYFQDFMPNNFYDDRIVIIGNRAIAIRRKNRKNDFRASGSGLIEYNYKLFNVETIKTAFEVVQKLQTQSLAFDFIYDGAGNPLIVELSYGYAQGPAYDNCPGYWDSDLRWHEGVVNPQHFIIEDFINRLRENEQNH